MKARVNTEWICEYPPTVAAVSSTTLSFTTKNTKNESTATGGTGGQIDEAEIDLLIAKKIKNKTLITNRIETFEIITTKSTGFTTDCDEDVIFNGRCGTEDKWFWNGASSTMYVDGYIETRETCITINGSKILTEDDAGKTVGIKFKYWDTDDSQEELGWFGFDPATKCFRYLLDASVCSDTNIDGCDTCQILSGTPGDICTDTFVAQNLRNKSLEQQDLNIITDQGLQVTATENIDMDSATYTLETTTGTIISNTGTSGVDILSSNGNIDITSTNAEMNLKTNDDNMTINVENGDMEVCVEDGDMDICVDSTTLGNDLNIKTENNSAINITSDKPAAQAILVEATNGGIDINANGDPGEDIDITNTASVNIKGEESADDAVCIETPNGGICINANTTLDVDATDLDIDATGDTTLDTTNIDINSTGDTTLDTTDLDINSAGDTKLDTTNIDINSAGDTTFDTGLMTFTVTDDFVIDGGDKEDFRSWIPYKTWDVSCGYWQSLRDTSNGCALYYWRKVARNETVYLNLDLVNPFRKGAGDKGFKLDKIYFAYEIEDVAITSFTPTICLKTFDPDTPGTAVSLSSIAYTDGNLAAGTTVDEHYRYVEITTPTYLSTESVINIEIELVTPADSVFKFYGAMIHYTGSFY